MTTSTSSTSRNRGRPHFHSIRLHRYSDSLSWFIWLSGICYFQRIKEIGIRKYSVQTPAVSSVVVERFFKAGRGSCDNGLSNCMVCHEQLVKGFCLPCQTFNGGIVLAGLIAALIAFAPVSFQLLKLLFSNPVKSLRAE